MKLKTLIVAVLLLGALSVVAFLVNRPAAPASADPRLNQPLLDQATAEKAAKLRLSDAGKSVQLIRQTDGSWRVADYFDFPADFAKLSGFIGNLTEAKLQRLVTSNPERIARLEFKDARIELLDAADKPLWSATLGKNSESGDGRYVRFGDESKAYLANLNAWLDVEAKNWAATELLALKPEDVARMEIPFAAGETVAVARAKKEEPWTTTAAPAGQRIKADKISSLLSAVGSLRFTDTSESNDANAVAARANARVLKLTTFDGKTVAISLGRKPEEKKLKSPTADAKSGPAALGSATDLLKKEGQGSSETAAKMEPAKPLAPEFETTPAGPVFVSIVHSDSAAPINALMQKRAFQIADHAFTSLPQKSEELFEPAPATTTPASQTVN